MVKLLLFSIIIATIYLKLSASTAIECSYKPDSTLKWNIAKDSYDCIVKNDPNIITRESTTIDSVTGAHRDGKTDDDVEGLLIRHKTVNYFPYHLGKFFTNIKSIQIHYCKLKKIYRRGLKHFPKLIEIYLDHNDLVFLEEDLFEFNPDLESIAFGSNKIFYIEPNTFDNLNKLKFLGLQENLCISKRAENSQAEVKNLIQEIKSKCANYRLEQTISALESKVNSIVTNFKDLMTSTGTCKLVDEHVNVIDRKLEVLKQNDENGRNLANKQMQNFRDEMKADHAGILTAIRLKTDKIEDKIVEQNEKFEGKLARIMKALQIDE